MLSVDNPGRFPDPSRGLRCTALAAQIEGKDKEPGVRPGELTIPARVKAALVRSLADGERPRELTSPKPPLPEQPGHPAACCCWFWRAATWNCARWQNK